MAANERASRQRAAASGRVTTLAVSVATAALLLGALGAALLLRDGNGAVRLALDREHLDPQGRPINPATQSINRYASVLRHIDRLASVELDPTTGTLSFTLAGDRPEERVELKNVHASFLLPLLTYRAAEPPDAFDHANLMLAEYARNGVSLSYHTTNDLFGYFTAADSLFSDSSEDEFAYTDGQLAPNPTLRPLRFAVTNNCLKPGLWEFSASDTVGEMYHSWFNFPQSTYFSLIRQVNRLELSDRELAKALKYKKRLEHVPARLERLRTEGPILVEAEPRVVASKTIGGYSSQDSRRKVQRRYFRIKRRGRPLEARVFADLLVGDTFALRRFVAPGVYSSTQEVSIPFDPDWNKAVVRQVTPLTRYPGGRQLTDQEETELSHLEITLYKSDGAEAVVLGNLPIAVLVPQDDYLIPALGAGPLPPSEPIERRYLRFKEGPVPHYAYQLRRKDDGWFLINNHETGIEQIVVRPFFRGQEAFLVVTLVAYERIVDLLELRIPVAGPLADRLRQARDAYRPPLYRTYLDDNVL